MQRNTTKLIRSAEKALSFEKETHAEEYHFFWRVFRNQIFGIVTTQRPVFRSPQDLAEEFVRNIIHQEQPPYMSTKIME